MNDLERIFNELSSNFNALSNRYTADFVRRFERMIFEANDLLIEYSNEGGLIERNRLYRIARDLERIERDIRDEEIEYFEEVIFDVTTDVAEEIKSELGLAITAGVLSAIGTRISSRILNKEGSDGVTLKHRIWSVVAELRNGIVNVVQNAIIRGRNVAEAVVDIRNLFRKESWKIERIVRTEMWKTFRYSIVETIKADGLTVWVKFFDGTCGRPDHHRHKCYTLANEDRYDMGVGIFNVSDEDILMPHPQCTSYFIPYIPTKGGDH